MWHINDHCIIVSSKWIFRSNFEVEFLHVVVMTLMRLNFVGAFHAIREVHPEVVQIRLNIKQELLINIIIVIITIYITVIFIFHIFITVNILSCFNFIQYDLMILLRQ